MNIQEHEEGYNPLQSVKRRFFALRNGVIADTLRKGGSPFRIIFGLNLPQLRELAAWAGKDASLARELRANRTTRESQLLAPMLMPVEMLSAAEARSWLLDCQSREVTDVLCHSLLRHHPEAVAIADSIPDNAEDSMIYAALRLIMNILSSYGPEKATTRARLHLSGPNAALARRIIDETEFLSGS